MKDEIIRRTTDMWAPTIEEISADFERLGIILREQLDKRIISRPKGLWSSIAFKFRNKNKFDKWEEPRVMLASFKVMKGMYTRYSYFNIRCKQEAINIIRFLIEAFDINYLEFTTFLHDEENEETLF